MKVLFIGGTGIISTACTKLAVHRGIEVTLLTRGRHEGTVPSEVTVVNVDVHDTAAAARALAGASFDA
ncbi:MAG TPA: NAD(P)H-binding protein, partial [Candidatus Dormibacteraeota bacterium]|nr:NAD(P)H-binding protein [Candidatus Dormibacteraeota bacterium]